MFSYVLVAGAAYTAHKLLSSTAAFINALNTIPSLKNETIVTQNCAVEDFEGLLKIAYIMIQDYDVKSNLDEAKIALCRKSLSELETKMDTLFKAKEKYESEWFHVYAFEDAFYKNQMLKAATILRLRLRFLEQ